MALGKTAVVSHLYLVTPSNENRSVTNQPARSARFAVPTPTSGRANI